MNGKLKTLKREFQDRRDIAYRYFRVISIFGDLNLTEREIDLLAHIAIKGHIGSVNSRKEFMKLYKTTMATVNNTISMLYKKKLLIKVNRKIRINPKIDIDFFEKDCYIFNLVCLYQNELKTK